MINPCTECEEYHLSKIDCPCHKKDRFEGYQQGRADLLNKVVSIMPCQKVSDKTFSCSGCVFYNILTNECKFERLKESEETSQMARMNDYVDEINNQHQKLFELEKRIAFLEDENTRLNRIISDKLIDIEMELQTVKRKVSK